KFKSSKSEDDDAHLFDLTTHLMADYQMEVIRLDIKELEKQMADPAATESPDRMKELQLQYQTLLKARNALAKRLGERVINL
ncbi:MAG: hypothetical protein J5869_02725, partial [Bacteroidaceae bacterium]|nr:hypothetical protein [Bacteroidaceae bacterium]